MTLGAFGRTFARMMAPLRRRPGDKRYTALAKRIEERAYIVSTEAHAYVDHRISAFKRMPAETDRQIEARARLASQEAKAYADDAIHSLSMALRAMTKVLAGVTRRFDALEAAQAETQAGLARLGEELMQASVRLDEEFAAFALRINETAEVSRSAQKRVGKIDDGFLDLSTDVAGVETALREIDAQLGALMRHVDMPGPFQTRGLRPPAPTDVAPAQLKK